MMNAVRCPEWPREKPAMVRLSGASSDLTSFRGTCTLQSAFGMHRGNPLRGRKDLGAAGFTL
jgi:hypothetical protein